MKNIIRGLQKHSTPFGQKAAVRNSRPRPSGKGSKEQEQEQAQSSAAGAKRGHHTQVWQANKWTNLNPFGSGMGSAVQHNKCHARIQLIFACM